MNKAECEKRKKILWAVVSPLLAVLTVWAVLKQNGDVSVNEIMEAAGSAEKPWLLAAVICSFLYIWFEGVAVRTILKSAGFKKNHRNGLLYASADVYFSAITPSATGGQPAAAFFMSLDGIPAGIAAAALVLNLMMYTLSVIVLGIAAEILYPNAFFGFSSPSKALIILGAVVLFLLSAAFFVLMLKGERVFSLTRRFIAFLKRKTSYNKIDILLKKLSRAERDYSSCIEIFSKDKLLLFKSFFWNIMQRASQIAVPSLLYRALEGGGANAGVLFSKQCLITIGYNFVPVPGAMGVSDYMMIDGYSEVVGKNTALTLELLSRGSTFYVCVTVSAVITLIGYIIKTTRKKKK